MKPQRFSSRTRDLLSSQPGQNGKGSADRTTDDKAYRDGYDYWKKCEAEKRSAAESAGEVQQSAALQSGGVAGNETFPFSGAVEQCGSDGIQVIEGSRCFCDSEPCRCEGELGYLEPAPRALPSVPAKKHSEGSECAGSPRHIHIDNSQRSV